MLKWLDVVVGAALLVAFGIMVTFPSMKAIHMYNQFLMLCYAYPSVVHWVFFGFVMVALQVVFTWTEDIYDLWKGECSE